MKSRRTKALEIPKKVKDAVWERDGHAFVLCGSNHGEPVAHYISRAQGGLGIEKNVVTLCPACHRWYDNTSDRARIRACLRAYLMQNYADWNEESLYYRKDENA